MVRSANYQFQQGLNVIGASMEQKRQKDIQDVKDQIIMDIYKEQLEQETAGKLSTEANKVATLANTIANTQSLIADREEKQRLARERVGKEADSVAQQKKNEEDAAAVYDDLFWQFDSWNDVEPSWLSDKGKKGLQSAIMGNKYLASRPAVRKIVIKRGEDWAKLHYNQYNQ